jgi:hypothetical protein
VAVHSRSAVIEVEETARTPGVEAALTEAAILRTSAIACGLVALLLWLGPYLWRVDLFSEDAAQHVFWFWRFIDPSAFAHDPAADYFSSISVAPWGYRVLYAALVPLSNPQFAAELVIVALLGASVWLAWKLGAALAEEGRELRALLTVVALLFLISCTRSDLITPMGLQRSFALPLTLLMAWALVTRRHLWVGVSWVLAALFYPVIVPVLGLSALAVWAVEYARERQLPAGWWLAGFLGIAAIAIVLTSAAPPAWAGPTVTYDQALALPEFGHGGRLDLLGSGSGHWIRDPRYGIGWSPLLLLAFAVAAVIAARVRYAGRIPLAVWSLAVSGLLLWTIAHLTLFALYLPNRHSRTSIAVFGLVAIAAAATGLVLWFESRSAAWRAGRMRRLVAWIAPVLVAAFLLPGAWQNLRKPADADLERTYAFLATLPRDTVIAAHPALANFIPLRSARSVLVSEEVALPFMLGYYEKMRPRMEASLRAAYATSWDQMLATLSPYGVDVMVGGPTENLRPMPAPYRAFDERLRASAGTAAVLRSPPSENVLFRSGPYVVVRVSPRALPP